MEHFIAGEPYESQTPVFIFRILIVSNAGLLSLLKFLITSSYLERLSHLGWFKIKIMQFKMPTLTGWRERTCLFFRNACIYIGHRLMSAILILYLPFCYLFFILFIRYRVCLFVRWSLSVILELT